MKAEKFTRKKRSHSIYRTILVSMLLLLVIEMGLMLAALAASRLAPQLDQNAEQLLDKQVENRADYIQSLLLSAESVSELTATVNTEAEQLLQQQGLAPQALGKSGGTGDELLKQLAPQLVEFLRQKNVNGIFLLLNTQDLSQRQEGSPLPCFYVRDLDPIAPSSLDNSDLILQYAPSSVVQSLHFSTSNYWTPAYLYSGEQDFFYGCYQQAFTSASGLAANEFCRWTPQPYTLAGDKHPALAYMVPLSLSDGTVYGVLGVELLTSFLEQNYLPYGELQNDGTGSYLLLNTTQDPAAESLPVQATLVSSPDAAFLSGAELTLQGGQGAGVAFETDGESYYGRAVALSLYSRNAPFSGEHWLLLGAAPARQLYSFSHNMLRLLLLSMLLTLAVGSVGCLLVSRRLSRPIAKLSAEVEAAGHATLPQLSRTGIRELDQFSEAFSSRCQDAIFTSTFFLRIMEMSSVEIGGFELLYKTGTVFATDSFFPLLGLAKPSPLTPDSLTQALQQFTKGHTPVWELANGTVYLIPQEGDDFRYVRLQCKTEGDVQVGLVEDVTISAVERLHIEHARDYDILTGLYNRQAFQRECEKLFLQPEALQHAALVMLDLDNLKKVNDTFGHDMGDAYIRQTGQHMAAVQPQHAVFSRMAGDEFLLFFYGYPSPQDLQKDIDRLRESLHAASLDLPDGKSISISISGGVARFPEDSRDLDTLRRYADFAMYQVKHGAKGHLYYFKSKEYEQNALKEQVSREFRQMVAEQHLPYHLQPIFDAHTGQPAAYEALMRPDYPALNSPALVISTATELGEQYAIEHLTLFQGTETFHRLRRRGVVPPDALLFINSIANVHMSDADMQAFTARYQEIRPHIVVEITEEEQMTTDSLRIKRRHIGPGAFALDDYGNGYSNENALLELSPKYIKIDIRIVRDIDSNTDKQQIVRNAIAYAHPRGMKIVAEGVETAAELQTVLALGVDLLQGYYLARPAAVPGLISSEAQAVIDRANGRQH